MSLLDKFFAPPTKGAAGSGAAGAAHAGVAELRLDYSIPGPFGDDDSGTAEDLWDTVWLADIPLPPVGTGFATLTCAPKIKVDKKAGIGAAKPKTTTTGAEATEGTITVKFVQEALPAMLAATVTLYPGGGALPIKHPKATMAKLKNVEITAWSDSPSPDAYGVFTWVLHYHEVSAAAQAGKGGNATKTSKNVWVNAKPGDQLAKSGASGAAIGAALSGEDPPDGLAQKVQKKKAATSGATP